MNVKDSINEVSDNIANNKNIITKCTFTADSKMFMLQDHVIIYNSNDKWKIVLLEFAKANPIIYDDDNTFVLCPITLRCAILKGIYDFEKYNGYQRY